MKNKKGIKIQATIREILFYDWDPINISYNENLKDEYDSYIAGVYRILTGSRNRNELAEYLRDMVINEIGNELSDEEHEQKLKGIAEKLLSIDTHLWLIICVAVVTILGILQTILDLRSIRNWLSKIVKRS